MRRCRILGVLLAAALLASGLVGLARAQGAGDVSYVIGDYFFEPAEAAVIAGYNITWTNTGREPHTVTSFDGIFNSPLLLNGASFTIALATPGEYWYFCDVHPDDMVAVLWVNPDTALEREVIPAPGTDVR